MHCRSHLRDRREHRSRGRVGPNRALFDLPQTIFQAYFLSMSFRDCLPQPTCLSMEAECQQQYFLKLTATCKLNADSALMILLSLATSTAFLGCTHGNVRCKLAF
jgi:hypothetical protein